MVTSNNDWIKVSWRNEYMKQQTSLKRVAEEVMRSVNAQVEFNAGEIIDRKRKLYGLEGSMEKA